MRRDTPRNTTREYCFAYPPVANSVGPMSRSTPDSHLTYDEMSSPTEMADDCRAVGHNLRYDRISEAAQRPVPSIHFADFPQEIPKREIQISEAATRLANALHLHLD